MPPVLPVQESYGTASSSLPQPLGKPIAPIPKQSGPVKDGPIPNGTCIKLEELNSTKQVQESPSRSWWDVLGRRYRNLRLRMSGRAPLLGLEPHIGKDRRRFIIISIFDASLATLLWLLCTVTKGDDWSKVFLTEINVFNPQFIHHSLFDVVLCAFFRMLVLILAYAICVVRHWLPVAITTTISSAFLLIKVLFFFSKTQGGLPQYLLVLTSFSIAWFELWLMPFRVLRTERRYERQHDSYDEGSARPTAISVSSTASRPRAAERFQRHHPPFSTDDEFRSAVEFSSDDETHHRPTNSHQIPSMLREIYEKALHEAEMKVEGLLRDCRSGNWKVLRAANPMVLLGPDGSYYVRDEFHCTPLVLFDAAWKDMLKWNTQVVEGRVIFHIDPTTELFYSVSAPAMRGYVSSRDFVDIRRIHLNSDEQSYSGTFVSVESNICPANANKKIVRWIYLLEKRSHVGSIKKKGAWQGKPTIFALKMSIKRTNGRGHNGPSIIRAVRGETISDSSLEWIMKTDLRGGLPKSLVQSSMQTYFIEHMARLKAYIEGLDGMDGRA